MDERMSPLISVNLSRTAPVLGSSENRTALFFMFLRVSCVIGTDDQVIIGDTGACPVKAGRMGKLPGAKLGPRFR